MLELLPVVRVLVQARLAMGFKRLLRDGGWDVL
jgi:hypothetical protein